MSVYDRFDEHARSIKERIQRFTIEYAPYLMLVGMITFEVLSRLFEVSLTTFFTPEFWSTLFINTLTATVSFACFVYYAERKKRESDSYLHNIEAWGAASQRVRSGSFDNFIDYCKAEYARECEDHRTALISNYTQISYSRWEEYRKLSDDDINALARDGVISKHDARILIRAKRHPRIKPINPMLILAGMRAGDINSAGRSNTSSWISVISRPVPVLVTSILFSMFAGQYRGVTDGSVLFDMLYTAGMIAMSSMMGFMKGCDNAERKHREIKIRIMFIERYEKKCKEDS